MFSFLLFFHKFWISWPLALWSLCLSFFLSLFLSVSLSLDPIVMWRVRHSRPFWFVAQSAVNPRTTGLHIPINTVHLFVEFLYVHWRHRLFSRFLCTSPHRRPNDRSKPTTTATQTCEADLHLTRYEKRTSKARERTHQTTHTNIDNDGSTAWMFTFTFLHRARRISSYEVAQCSNGRSPALHVRPQTIRWTELAYYTWHGADFGAASLITTRRLLTLASQRTPAFFFGK